MKKGQDETDRGRVARKLKQIASRVQSSSSTLTSTRISFPYLPMDPTEPEHESIPRISVDSLEDWYRIKESYTKAAMDSLERRVASTPRSTQDIERLRQHLKLVSVFRRFISKMMILNVVERVVH